MQFCSTPRRVKGKSPDLHGTFFQGRDMQVPAGSLLPFFSLGDFSPFERLLNPSMGEQNQWSKYLLKGDLLDRLP